MLGALIGVPPKIRALLDRFTAARAANLDKLDVPVSSRAPAATALSTAVWTQAHADAVLAGGGGNSKCQEFTAPGAFSFVVPSGVSLIYVTLQAPGGCGGKHASAPSGGGSGELIRRYPLPVNPGATVNGNLGAGITTTPTQNSTFGGLTTTGGIGRTGGGGTSGPGGGVLGAPAATTNGTAGSSALEILGGSSGGAAGGSGGPCGRFAGGAATAGCAGGAASYFAVGGAANNAAAPAQPGPGAGGGGTISGATGGPGGNGYCMVEWIG